LKQQTTTKLSKIKIKTRELLRKRLARDIEEGGISSVTIAPPGEGKTNQLIHDVYNIFKYHPTEIVFWRDNPKSAVQYNKEGVPWEIFVEEGCNISFRDLTSGGFLKIKYTIFNNFDELINKDTGQGLVKPQQLNVIYFKNEYTWIDLCEHLRHTIGWQNIFIDEIEDLIPLNPPRRPEEVRLQGPDPAAQGREVRRRRVGRAVSPGRGEIRRAAGDLPRQLPPVGLQGHPLRRGRDRPQAGHRRRDRGISTAAA